MSGKNGFADMDKIRVAASAMNAPPIYIADVFGVSPERVEKLLRRRSQWVEGLSICENVDRFYGIAAVRALEAAI